MALPSDMLVMEMDGRGGPEVLRRGRQAVPEPGPGELLIEVHAAGLNRADLNSRSGRYLAKGHSEILGLEVAGVVVASGAGVRRHRPGDLVCARAPGGGYAEYCIVRESQTLRMPGGLSFAEAASLPIAYLTVWANLVDDASLRKGETLLVHGGASGVGVAAIQLAKARGARTFVTAGSAEKCAACVDLGAELAIDYRKQDFVSEILSATGGQGVDVILDMVAGDYVPRDVEAMAFGGRLLLISLLGGDAAPLNLDRVVRKRLTIKGAMLSMVTEAFRARICRLVERHVWPLLESGQIRAVIHKSYPLVEAIEAHRELERGDHIGKIVLDVR